MEKKCMIMLPKLFRPCATWLIIYSLLGSTTTAQLVNSGGTITITDGALLVCTGDITNVSGTITNDGKLEVQGSFLNSGMYYSTENNDSLLMTGEGMVTLNAGSSFLSFLQINKISDGGVILSANATIQRSLDFIAGKFSTDPSTNYELIAPVSATFSFAEGTEITGKVRRTAWSNGNTVMFNQTNMTVTTTGGTSPTSLLVNMLPGGNPSASEREVNRFFYFDPTEGSGYAANVTLPYKSSELNSNLENNLAPWYYASTEWNGKLTGNTLNKSLQFVSATGIAESSFSKKEWKLADPFYGYKIKALLRGPFAIGDSMRTGLLQGGIIPFTQPYNVSPWNYAGTESAPEFTANTVDWILLEFRKPVSGFASDATSSTIVGQKAVLLMGDGTLKDVDGVSDPLIPLSKQGAGFVVLRHRNHLALMSNSLIANTGGTFTNDFTDLYQCYSRPGATSGPAVQLPGSAKYGMWAGDVNRNGSITIADITPVNLYIYAGNANMYDFRDVNMDRNFTVTDVSITNTAIAATAQGNASRTIKNNVQSHVPADK